LKQQKQFTISPVFSCNLCAHPTVSSLKEISHPKQRRQKRRSWTTKLRRQTDRQTSVFSQLFHFSFSLSLID